MEEIFEMTNIAKRLIGSLRGIGDEETRYNVGFVLTRVNNSILGFRSKKDPSGNDVPKKLAGEYLLKTWRIARENDILVLVKQNIPSDFTHYNKMCSDMFILAKHLIGQKYQELFQLVQKETRINLFLIEAADAFDWISQQEESPAIQRKLTSTAGEIRKLAYLLYNGATSDGRFISFNKSISYVENVWAKVKERDWEEVLSGSLRTEGNKLNEVADAFGAFLSPYIRWTQKKGSTGDLPLKFDVTDTKILRELRFPVREFDTV